MKVTSKHYNALKNALIASNTPWEHLKNLLQRWGYIPVIGELIRRTDLEDEIYNANYYDAHLKTAFNKMLKEVYGKDLGAAFDKSYKNVT